MSASALPNPTQHGRRLPMTVRIAVWSSRHRWPVAAVWLVLTVGVFVLSNAMGGIRTEDTTDADNAAASTTESQRGPELFNASSTGPKDPYESIYVVISHPTMKVTDPAYQAAIGDIALRLRAVKVDSPLASGPAITQLAVPNASGQPLGLISPDLSSVRIFGRLDGEGDAVAARLAPLKPALADLKAAHPDYTIRVLESTIINDDINTLIKEDLDGSLRMTIPLTFLILLLAFGAVAAAVVPLLLAFSALLAAFGLLGIFSQLVAPVSSYATQLIVLIGLAVAVDYSLFMISRFRSERRRGRDKLTAIEIASSTAGRAVFFSGLAVVVSIAGLLLMNDSLFHSMALGTISVVLVSVIGSLTFLPAVLSILGRGVDWGRIPFFGRDRPEGTGFWSRIVGLVMRRPATWAVTTTILLLLLAVPLLHLRLGQTDITAFPDSIEGVAAIKQLQDKFPQGTTLSLDVYFTGADRADVRQAIDGPLQEAALGLPGLNPVARPVTYSEDKTVAQVSFSMGGAQNDEANQALVRTMRTTVVPSALGGLPGVQGYVSGRAAFVLDRTASFTAQMPLVFAFVLTLSFLLLMLAFHSLVIPLKALILNLLSAGAAYGAMILVFQDGWFGSVLGIKPTSVIEAWVPIFIFTILFGLSMDYHVFILTRVKEARDRGMSSNDAVARGISVTSGVVTSAATIMVVVFGVFVTLRLVIIQQLGLGLAVAVLVDATLIRSILLPASMRLLGDWNWWMPRWLGWLPRVTIESESEADDVEDEREPAAARRASQPASEARPARRFPVTQSDGTGDDRPSAIPGQVVRPDW